MLTLPHSRLACSRANAQQPKLFVGMILILIFAEALALYGLIGELHRLTCAAPLRSEQTQPAPAGLYATAPRFSCVATY